MLKNGLYEQLITRYLNRELSTRSEVFIKKEKFDSTDSPEILARFLSETFQTFLHKMIDRGATTQELIRLLNRILVVAIEEIGEFSEEEILIDEEAELLLSIFEKKNSVYSLDEKVPNIRPETSMTSSSLFTGSKEEPSMFTELQKEIVSSNRIDMLISFIKWSGLRLIMNELQSFTMNGGILRVITTSYMGATDSKAVKELSKLPNTQIKISYDTKRTRLHAKTYSFIRNTGFSTAYVGSSNLSNAAISSGLEWNVKITAKDQPFVMKKIRATFDGYWNSQDFKTYNLAEEEEFKTALKMERNNSIEQRSHFLFDIVPFSYQQEILDKLDAERKIYGRYKNLIVAATGTGKTIISAFDYKRFRSENPSKSCRLLFVAHRSEILKQGLECFQGVLRDQNFGSIFDGNQKPSDLEHLFVTIQTFNSQELQKITSQEYYDYIVVDETHHATAETYQNLLSHYNPKILLGLTATPERMDGGNILPYFDYRIAAEIRLPEAIERRLLSPFQYFGVSDSVDLNEVKWTAGGYDLRALSDLFTNKDGPAARRADQIADSVLKYVTDWRDIKGLGFCVTVEHAKFMADYFNEFGIPSIHLTGLSPREERESVKKKLQNGDVKFVFVVDIYNEGVDIPEINTILFLRPTQSLTIFLQQLGRGLRITPEKDCLTVLDFVGDANKRYNFEEKYKALLSNPTRGIEHEINNNFPDVPKGCFIQLERKTQEIILENIRNSIGTRSGLISRISTFEADTKQTLTLQNFVNYYKLDVREIYKFSSFSRLCVNAGIKPDFHEEIELPLKSAFKKICTIDSFSWLELLDNTLSNLETLDSEKFTESETLMFQMFQFTVWRKSYEECGFDGPKEGLKVLSENKVLFEELKELLKLRLEGVDFVSDKVYLGFDCPLELHSNYTRDQILTAMGYLNPTNIREGVKYLAEKKTYLLFITLNKSDKDYSPSTMYDDYSVSEDLFHWQSQSTTSESSPTGQRYINQDKLGSNILIFVRNQKKDSFGTAPYTYLGPAVYVEHEGSNPMNILWKLRTPIPARYLKETNKLVVN